MSLTGAQQVVWVILLSYSHLSERDSSTKCLVMPHTFGELFWASMSTHIAEPTGVMSSL